MTAETDSAPVKHRDIRGRARELVGVLLAVMGLFWLAHKAGWIPAEHGHPAMFWPFIMIVIGLFLVFSTKHRRTA